jgi:NAD(P)-dependent dehydrogenase (short-subunit alcohol dehydrogenase family)
LPGIVDGMTETQPLAGRVALVAGATRGCGRAIAVELARAGAFVYATGRSTTGRRSEMDRPETIEQTLELIEAAGGRGAAAAVDHLVADQVRALVDRIRAEQGRLDILVNDIWGGDPFAEWGRPLWEQDLAKGLHLLDVGLHSHIITSHFALGLLAARPGGVVIEITDGTNEFNVDYRGELFYDLCKTSVNRIALAQAKMLEPFGCTAIGVTPGFLRSEAMLDHFGVTEQNWRDAVSRDNPHFSLSETPTYVARGIARLVADPDAKRFAGQVLYSGLFADEYGVTDLDGTRPNFEKYARENDLGADEPVDDAKYR